MTNRVEWLDSFIGLAFSHSRILKKLGGGMGVVTVAAHACLHDTLRLYFRFTDLPRKRRLALGIREQRPWLDSAAASNFGEWSPMQVGYREHPILCGCSKHAGRKMGNPVAALPTDPPIRLRIPDYLPAAASLCT